MSTILPDVPGSYPVTPVERFSRTLGAVRLGVLFFLTAGVLVLPETPAPFFVLSLYVLNLVVSTVGIVPERLPRRLRERWPVVHIILDFVIVATTVNVTGGPTSLFTSIFIVVVLECGILLGMGRSFVVSTGASLYMLLQVLVNADAAPQADAFELLYNFLVQTRAFYLTAFMAGFWSQRLRQLQAFQRDILDNMNSGFLITDNMGTITASNHAAGTILGYDRELVGRSVADIVRDASGGESPVVTALRSGRDYMSYEFTAPTFDGGRKLLGLTTSRMYDSRTEGSGIIATFTDLTEMNLMRQEVRRQDRMAVVGELAAGLAHEIRNPVAVIRGAADEMRRHPENSSVQPRLRNMVIRESDQLNDIVTGFLDFAREPSIKRENLNILDIITEVRESLLQENSNGGSPSRIVVNAASPSCTVSGDASQLKQVFVNLGKNALDAMTSGGTLTISIEEGNGGPVHIRFEDEGPGIEPDKVAHIFEPFYTTKRTGVGMGLAVCARILTSHDGTIRATSREGGGCSMNITLPAVAAPEKKPSE